MAQQSTNEVYKLHQKTSKKEERTENTNHSNKIQPSRRPRKRDCPLIRPT